MTKSKVLTLKGREVYNIISHVNGEALRLIIKKRDRERETQFPDDQYTFCTPVKHWAELNTDSPPSPSTKILKENMGQVFFLIKNQLHLSL